MTSGCRLTAAGGELSSSERETSRTTGDRCGDCGDASAAVALNLSRIRRMRTANGSAGGLPNVLLLLCERLTGGVGFFLACIRASNKSMLSMDALDFLAVFLRRALGGLSC